MLHICMAKALGAGPIAASDISPYRLEMARRMGADLAIDAGDDIPRAIREMTGGRLADLVIACTGALPAIAQALKSVERGGTALLFAPTGPGEIVPLSVNDFFWRNDVTLTTSYAGSPADYADALELIRAKRVEVLPLITHRLPMGEIATGFRLVSEAKDSVKVIIEPQK